MTSEHMKKFAAEVESNEELKAKLRACKTQAEIEAVARENNFEISLDDLDSVAGGIKLRPRLNVKLTLRCPHCNSTNIPINPPIFFEQEEIRPFLESTQAKCHNCGKSGSAASFYDFADEFSRTMGL